MLSNKQYNYGFTGSDTYYLWIWLDKEETNNNTQNKGFEMSLSGSCTDSPTPQPEDPVLDEGMIPVTISDDGSVTTISEKDSSWYNYDNQKWANVVLVNNTSRSKYQNTYNVEVNQSDILAYYVWIPRYKYKITEVTCGDIADEITENTTPECYGWRLDGDFEATFREIVTYLIDADYRYPKYEGVQKEEYIDSCITKILAGGYCEAGHDFEWIMTEQPGKDYNGRIPPGAYDWGLVVDNKPSKQIIDIVFENGMDNRTMGDAVNTYYTHPAFWWDNDGDGIVDNAEMLSGIWVGKFETTGTDIRPTVLPNESPLTGQNIGDQYRTAENFSFSGNIYGLVNVNSHMMKNSEWGAVVYLTYSKQTGFLGEISFNDSMKTGCGYSFNPYATSGCESKYGSRVLYEQSTTWNISGVFDMSGGANEYVMGNYNRYNGSAALDMDPVVLRSKYVDIYTHSNVKGHALDETAGWYNDNVSFIEHDYPWLLRGGSYDLASGYGPLSKYQENVGIFAYYQAGGGGVDNRGFRSVIINGFSRGAR